MKKLIKTAFIATAIAGAISFANTTFAQDFVEGKDYTVLSNPENINKDVIVVREFFWYGCPHCYNLEPFIEKWAATRAKDVAFFRTPAAMNPVWEQNARGFYAVQMMGLDGATHQAMFDALNKDGKKLYDQNSIANWYGQKGVDVAKFNSLYNSFAVTTKVQRSNDAAKRYQVTGTPAVVVQGKYVIEGSDGKVIQVLDYLINKVREENKAK